MIRLLNYQNKKLFSTISSKYYLSAKSNSACADVFLVPMFTDNYGFIIIDRNTGIAACVDPADSIPVHEAVQGLKCDLKMLLCTHKHTDHTGGNYFFSNNYHHLEVISTKYEDTPAVTKYVGDGDQFNIGSLNVKVFHTPCHTKGHIIYYITGASGHPILFSGDTLFVGGCGRFFEGSAEQMLQNLNRISLLPKETIVFCGHEYTESNYLFLASIDPGACFIKLKEIKEKRQRGESTVPTTIEEETKYNLFMKCHDKKLQELIGVKGKNDIDAAVMAMAKLREMKNAFR